MPWDFSGFGTVSFLPRVTMPKLTTDRKIGGEYGDVRAAIDVEKLNAYLTTHVLEVATPVTVKQFKVSVSGLPRSRALAYGCTGFSLDRYTLATPYLVDS
jgi:hypothetical protein